MSKGAKLFWGLVVLAILIIIVALARTPSGGGPTAKLPEGPITIGAVVPLTGDGAAYGIPIQRAGQIALEEINAAGGISGHELKVVWEDGKCEGKEATSAAQKLINIDQVKVIFGGVCSSENLAMADLINPAKVLVISPSATNPDITLKGGDFMFRTSPSDAAAGSVAADYAYKKLEAKKSAVISETKDYAQGLRRVFTENFKALGGEIVADETYNTGDTDMRTQILKIKTAAPEVIYIVPQTPSPGVLILKQLKAQGVEAKLLTAEVMIGRNVVAENKKNMEGLVGIENWFDEKGDLAAKFLAKYKEQYKEDPAFPSFMSNMYSMFYLLKEGVEKQGLDTEKLRDWLYGLKDWKHALGSLTLDKNGDPVGLPYSVKKVEGGELKELEVYRPSVQ